MEPNYESRWQNAILLLRLAWYALWDWSAIKEIEELGSVPDIYGDGINTHYELHVITVIDTSTRWYLLKRAWRKLCSRR